VLLNGSKYVNSHMQSGDLMRRNTTLLLAVLVSLCGITEASALCRTDVASFYGDITSLKLNGEGKPNANANLYDYGVIFEDANNPACAQTANIALYKKVKATLALPAYYDGNVNRTVGPYDGWLEGANVGLVYAAALRLGANGALTWPTYSLLGQIVYDGYVDAHCGFASNRLGETAVWRSGNSCMDDWAVAAHGFGWTAAWRSMAYNYPFPYDSATRSAIQSALDTNESVCLHKDTAPPANPAPAAGPCTATVAEVANGTAVALALHNGDAMPYGIGLMTSVASGNVALAAIGQSATFSSDQLTIAKSLFKNGDHHTSWEPTYQYSFNADCYSFSLGANGELVRPNPPTFGCYEAGYGDGKTGGYQPEMFPVKDYYDAFLGGAPSTVNYDFSTFNDSLFCDDPNNGNCAFFSPGRKAVYKTLGHDWVYSRPNLSASHWDYTTTFKTYDNAHYLSARNGGGSDVNAEPTSASLNETFSMVDVNGGALTSGDVVWLQVANGNYVSADNGGGSTVIALYDTPVGWERFTIEKMNGTGQISSGNTVALKALYGQYISAVNGGGSNTVAMYTSAITWEVFTINYTR
jgi:hypothetical protein